MVRLEISKSINANLDRVWSIISDLDNEPKYWHGTKSVKNIDVKGDKIVREVVIAFRNSKCKEIIEMKKNKSIDIEIVDGPMKGHKIITLNEDNGKTRVDVIWDIKLSGFLSMFTNMVKGHIEDGTRDALERISKECENN
ncbi:MAG: SRPBCC family protein [Candidatus Nitrosocaldaceae archaeon]